MRRLSAGPLLAALAIALPGASQAASRGFTVTDFDRIRVSGPYEVVVRTGPAAAARAEGSPQALDRLRIEVNARTLSIRTDRTDSGWQDRGEGKVRIAITVPQLIAAAINGSGSLAIDRAKAARFDLTLAGSGDIRLAALTADRVIVGINGSGDVALGGKVAQARIIVQGSGDVDAGGLVAQDADISVSGSSNVTLAATRTAKVDARGAGDVTVLGKPVCTVRASGAGNVACGPAR
ncbi:head GIN domain-containing protein [Sphingomonas sp. 1P06PA]|uniref:head GIN domain-containing protein n=1 Tax=Sphingomonas sp. 1P06PA TaxID=554121 RepID=UPI0039A776E3